MTFDTYMGLFILTLGIAWGFVTTIMVLWCLSSKSKNRVGLAVYAFFWCTLCAGCLNFWYMDILWRNIVFVPTAVGGVAFAIYLNHLLKD